MNRIEKQKKQLISLSVIILVISILAFIGGIALTVLGGMKLANAEYLPGGFALGFGILLMLLSIFGIIFGIIFTFTGKTLKATHGSIADDNLSKGTVNMIKCPNCGNEIAPSDKVCANCGKAISNKKVCPKCGKENRSNAKHCTDCGTEL